MANIIQLKLSTADSFKALPESIKDWLGSDLITNYISDINKKLGIKGERRSIIPRLIVRLVAKDLLPQNFIDELAKALNAPPAAAKAIAQEISDKALQPIEIGLRRDTGVDVKTIFFGKPKEIKEGELGPLETIESDAAPAPFTFEERPAVMSPIKTPPIKPEIRPIEKEEPTASETPILIYKEGAVGRIPIAKPEITLKPQPVLKTELEISIKPRTAPPLPVHDLNGDEKQASPVGRPTPPPLPARSPLAQTPSQPLPTNEPKIVRVVHYSDFFTPLNSFGLDKKHKQNDSAFVDGNVVDLRFI